jgi:hypothetical protein
MARPPRRHNAVRRRPAVGSIAMYRVTLDPIRGSRWPGGRSTSSEVRMAVTGVDIAKRARGAAVNPVPGTVAVR